MESDNGLNNIKKMYDKLTYFDKYGSSVIIFIIISIMVILICSYCYIMINIQPIKEDWSNQRCKPTVIPFAGLINKPKNMSINDFTVQNFNYCTQNILSSVTGTSVEPLTFIINMLNTVVESIKKQINGIRAIFDKVRTLFEDTVKEIMGRLMNIMIPLQKIIIGLKDMMGKIQGTMTASLFTVLGSYYSLKALMGAIAQFIIIILIAMAIMIAIFWIIPFTWGAALSLTGIFVGFSIPMALILAFMVDVLKVQTNLSIPSVKCFDKNTFIVMNDGAQKKIIDIEVGDVLFDGNEVTAKMKVETKGSEIYNLHSVIVSNSHIVKYGDKWLHVSEHPESIQVENYVEPYLYCLNTSFKIIVINDLLFTDWDEIVDENIIHIKNNDIMPVDNITDIHKYLDGGFQGSTTIALKNGTITEITNIEPGDILKNGEKVYGIVEINGKDLNEQCKYILGNHIEFEGGPNLCVCDKKIQITSTLGLTTKGSDKKIIYENKLDTQDKLYHLLTDSKTFYVNNIRFYDYNASIDLLLDKNKGKLLSMKYI